MYRREIEQYRELLEYASEARGKAYAPYSGFAVGAAVQTVNGIIYQGANLENASYGLTLCAERTALTVAFMAGERNFSALAVTADTPSVSAYPCGACLQVLWELAGNIVVLTANLEGQEEMYMLADLYPYPFPPYKTD